MTNGGVVGAEDSPELVLCLEGGHQKRISISYAKSSKGFEKLTRIGPSSPLAMLSFLAPVSASFQGIAPALTPARSQAVHMQMGGPPGQGFNVRDMPGVSGPLGFFDPLEFTKEASEGKVSQSP